MSDLTGPGECSYNDPMINEHEAAARYVKATRLATEFETAIQANGDWGVILQTARDMDTEWWAEFADKVAKVRTPSMETIALTIDLLQARADSMPKRRSQPVDPFEGLLG